MSRISAIAAMAWIAGGAQAAFGQGDGFYEIGGYGEGVKMESGRSTDGAAPAHDRNLFYGMRALGRAESRLTGAAMDGSTAPEALIDRNRDLGRAESRWFPEDLGVGVVERQAINEGATRGEACSRIRLKRDC